MRRKQSERRHERRETIRYETRYEREFCRLQPYAGVGLGVYFANLSNNGNSVSDNAVPGLNALAGVRYYFTERIALFGEYKYNWAAMELTNGGIGGFQRRLPRQPCGRRALVPLLTRAHSVAIGCGRRECLSREVSPGPGLTVRRFSRCMPASDPTFRDGGVAAPDECTAALPGRL